MEMAKQTKMMKVPMRQMAMATQVEMLGKTGMVKQMEILKGMPVLTLCQQEVVSALQRGDGAVQQAQVCRLQSSNSGWDLYTQCDAP